MRFVDLTGRRFNRLIVISMAGRNTRGRFIWRCKCDCGNEKNIVGSSLASGHSTSCGCRKLETPRENGMKNLIDLSGKRFGRLVVIEWSANPKTGKPAWKCKCDCGKEAYKKGSHLTQGRTVSCGCYHHEEVSNRVRGEGNPMHGLPRELNPMQKPDVRAKVSEKLRGKNNPMYGRTLEKNPAWKGGISFEPYCHKFNKTFREHVRTKFDRKCFVCGACENVGRHCVHHIDYNKTSICNGQEWAFVPLCHKHHAQSGFNRWWWFNLLICYWAIQYMPEGCVDARILVC